MIIDKGIVQGSIKPPEWDLDSSEVTVYHRTNIKEVQTDFGTVWEYNEEQMNFKDYALYTQKMINEIEAETLKQKVSELEANTLDLAEAFVNKQFEQDTATLGI